jgi:hypothetical protein
MSYHGDEAREVVGAPRGRQRVPPPRPHHTVKINVQTTAFSTMVTIVYLPS